jgi:2-hydroxy-3-oxopropionate reductase
MGLPMARNLLAAGFDLVGHSRSPRPVEELVDAGASRGGSPADVAAAAELTVLMLPDDDAVQQVVEGPDGVLEGAKPGHLLVDMSTVSPERAARTAERMAGAGGTALDAPVSGGDVGARNGTLAIMVGGPADAFEHARPVFEVVGSRCGVAPET